MLGSRTGAQSQNHAVFHELNGLAAAACLRCRGQTCSCLRQPGRRRCGAEKAGMLIHDDMYGDCTHQPFVTTLVGKGFHECAVLEFGKSFGAMPPPHRHH